MPTVQEQIQSLTDTATRLQQEVDNYQAQVAAGDAVDQQTIATLQAEITRLQEIIDSADATLAAQLEPVVASLNATIADISAPFVPNP